MWIWFSTVRTAPVQEPSFPVRMTQAGNLPASVQRQRTQQLADRPLPAPALQVESRRARRRSSLPAQECEFLERPVRGGERKLNSLPAGAKAAAGAQSGLSAGKQRIAQDEAVLAVGGVRRKTVERLAGDRHIGQGEAARQFRRSPSSRRVPIRRQGALDWKFEPEGAAAALRTSNPFTETAACKPPVAAKGKRPCISTVAPPSDSLAERTVTPAAVTRHRRRRFPRAAAERKIPGQQLAVESPAAAAGRSAVQPPVDTHLAAAGQMRRCGFDAQRPQQRVELVKRGQPCADFQRDLPLDIHRTRQVNGRAKRAELQRGNFELPRSAVVARLAPPRSGNAPAAGGGSTAKLRRAARSEKEEPSAANSPWIDPSQGRRARARDFRQPGNRKARRRARQIEPRRRRERRGRGPRRQAAHRAPRAGCPSWPPARGCRDSAAARQSFFRPADADLAEYDVSKIRDAGGLGLPDDPAVDLQAAVDPRIFDAVSARQIADMRACPVIGRKSRLRKSASLADASTLTASLAASKRVNSMPSPPTTASSASDAGMPRSRRGAPVEIADFQTDGVFGSVRPPRRPQESGRTPALRPRKAARSRRAFRRRCGTL